MLLDVELIVVVEDFIMDEVEVDIKVDDMFVMDMIIDESVFDILNDEE